MSLSTHSLRKHKIFKPSRLTARISHLVTQGKTASSESSNCKFSPSCLRRATQCSAPSTKTRARASRLPLRHGDFSLTSVMTSVMTAARAVCPMPHTAQFMTFKSEPSKRSLEADPEKHRQGGHGAGADSRQLASELSCQPLGAVWLSVWLFTRYSNSQRPLPSLLK